MKLFSHMRASTKALLLVLLVFILAGAGLLIWGIKTGRISSSAATTSCLNCIWGRVAIYNTPNTPASGVLSAVPNIIVTLKTTGGVLLGQVYSDANGYYRFSGDPIYDHAAFGLTHTPTPGDYRIDNTQLRTTNYFVFRGKLYTDAFDFYAFTYPAALGRFQQNIEYIDARTGNTPTITNAVVGTVKFGSKPLSDTTVKAGPLLGPLGFSTLTNLNGQYWFVNWANPDPQKKVNVPPNFFWPNFSPGTYPNITSLTEECVYANNPDRKTVSIVNGYASADFTVSKGRYIGGRVTKFVNGQEVGSTMSVGFYDGLRIDAPLSTLFTENPMSPDDNGNGYYHSDCLNDSFILTKILNKVFYIKPSVAPPDTYVPLHGDNFRFTKDSTTGKILLNLANKYHENTYDFRIFQ